jgi:hypothetical protein
MPASRFAPGFRLSKLDVVVLVVGTLLSLGLAAAGSWLALVVAWVIGHFFLFCNVFRLSRPLELVWAAVFVVLAGSTAATHYPGWAATTAISLAATVVVVAVEMRKPSYHGILWQRINPGLRAWWEAQVAIAETAQK